MAGTGRDARSRPVRALTPPALWWSWRGDRRLARSRRRRRLRILARSWFAVGALWPLLPRCWLFGTTVTVEPATCERTLSAFPPASECSTCPGVATRPIPPVSFRRAPTLVEGGPALGIRRRAAAPAVLPRLFPPVILWRAPTVVGRRPTLGVERSAVACGAIAPGVLTRRTSMATAQSRRVGLGVGAGAVPPITLWPALAIRE